jgi:hypothetical protein
MAKTSKNTSKKTDASRITKSQARKFLARVPEQSLFWCNDGNILRDLRELGGALAVMSDQTFTYHSNDEKKDFSNWIRDVIGDKNLAQTLESATSREQAARIVEERCSLLVGKAG